MAELRADDPSWRDKLARLILGDEKPSEMKRRAVQVTLGSTGLGNDGVSLVDATPLGMVFSGNDAVRSAQNGNYGEAALNALGAVPAGAVTAGAIKLAKGAKQAENIASRVVPSYSPPEKSQRPFEADYPNGARADAAGKLTHDIGGRMLAAEYIAGRRLVGADDVPLQSAEIRSIGEKATGRSIEAAPQGAGRGAGYLRLTPITRQPEQIFLSNKLSPTQADSVLGHEVGHVIDQIAGEIPTKGLSRELDPMYDALNTGRERTKNFTKPQHLGYSGDEIPREQMADAIRAYMTDPNYIKTVAPKTAARIREYVNTHPKLKDIIQFNSLAAAGGAGALAMGGADQAEAQTMSGPWEKYKAPETMPAAPWQKYAQQVAQQEPRSPEYNEMLSELSSLTGEKGFENFRLNNEADRIEGWRNPNSLSDAFDSVVRSGLPFGDEIAGAMGAIPRAIGDWAGGEGFDLGRSYDRSVGLERELQRRAEERSPVATTVGSVGGGVMLANSLAPISAIQRLSQGAGLGKTALASGVDSAVLGAAYGAGEGENLQERAVNSLGGGAAGATIGFATPLVVSGVSNLARRAVSPFSASPERQTMADILKREGVELTASQKTGSDMLRYAESEIGGKAAANIAERQGEQFTAAALKRAGVDAKRGTHEVIDGAFSRIGKQFDDLAARNSLVPDVQMAKDLHASVQGYYQNVPKAARVPLVENITRDIVGAAKNGNIAGEIYQSVRSRLDKATRKAIRDPELAEVYRGIRDTLDDAMQRSITKANPNDLGKWQTARRDYWNILTLEKALTGAGENTVPGIISPSQLRNAIVQQDRRAYARGKEDFAELSRAGEALMKAMPQSGTAPSNAVRAMGASASAVLGALAGNTAAPGIGAVAGMVAGASAPYALGRAMMTGPVQRYLSNQLMTGTIAPSTAGVVNRLTTGGALPAIAESSKDYLKIMRDNLH